ncbi:MAG: hypothetical protein IIC29_05080 [Chloroflexi bacterium]|nr:hypothetical protein [Chloroflexota bacterium]MCH8235479.1 hypothetical protein [Chloroflexota bacterium]
MIEPTAQVSDELLSRLADVSNATVLSALRQRGYHRVFMDGVKSIAPGRRLCARAVTLRSLPVRPDLAERIATGAHGDGFNETPRWQAVDSVGPGYALVTDAMRLSNVSTGGDVVYSRILTRNGAGLVTDGAVRDGAAVAAYGFPVYAGGTTSIVGEDHILPYQVNEPIQCGGVLVWPGDIVMGDDDGVVVLPSQLAEEILPWAIEHDEMEEAVLDHTRRTGESPSPYYPFNEETRRLWERWKADRA